MQKNKDITKLKLTELSLSSLPDSKVRIEPDWAATEEVTFGLGCVKRKKMNHFYQER